MEPPAHGGLKQLIDRNLSMGAGEVGERRGIVIVAAPAWDGPGIRWLETRR